MASKKLSIIIPTWNTSEITLRCVKTIKKYLTNFPHEIIVIDNGSTDNTQNIFKKESGIRLIINKTNLGFSKANNIAAKKSQGEYLLFLNSDMELIDSSIIKMYEYIAKNSSIGAIGPQFLNTDLSMQASVFPQQTPRNAFKEFICNQNTYSKYNPKTNKPTEVWSISGGALLISRNFFNTIGGWNEKYFFYFEDMDICRKIHQFNKKIIFFPNCKVIHRHGASGKNITSSNNQWKRLIPGSKIYHGLFNHYLINLIIWSGQKYQKLKKLLK